MNVLNFAIILFSMYKNKRSYIYIYIYIYIHIYFNAILNFDNINN